MVYAGVRKERDEESLNALSIKNIKPIQIDVTSTSSILKAKQRIESETNNLVGLVNNAGINKELPIEVQRLENMRNVFDVNIFGLVEVTQAFLPSLKENKGRVVNIGSVAGSVTVPMKVRVVINIKIFTHTHSLSYTYNINTGHVRSKQTCIGSNQRCNANRTQSIRRVCKLDQTSICKIENSREASRP